MQTLPYARTADQLPDGATAREAGLDAAALLGTWYATDPAADGVIRLELTRPAGEFRVHAFGAGAPDPFDWGEVAGSLYGSSVTSGEAMAFTARYDFGFLTTLLAAYSKQGILVLDTFNTFTDASGRADYFSREFFHR